jgi:hypothetical protein
MLGIRSAWREGTDFSPAEAVYGAQPILPGQFLAAEEDPSPPFLSDLQGILAGRALLPTSHHSAPAPQELPEDLLLAKHVLVRLYSVSTLPADLPAPPDRHGGIWSAASFSAVHDLGGSCGETTFNEDSQFCRPIYFIHI